MQMGVKTFQVWSCLWLSSSEDDTLQHWSLLCCQYAFGWGRVSGPVVRETTHCTAVLRHTVWWEGRGQGSV